MEDSGGGGGAINQVPQLFGPGLLTRRCPIFMKTIFLQVLCHSVALQTHSTADQEKDCCNCGILLDNCLNIQFTTVRRSQAKSQLQRDWVLL